MIRTVIRRMVLFPIAIIGSLIIYFVTWCFGGYKDTSIYIKRLLKEIWTGNLKE